MSQTQFTSQDQPQLQLHWNIDIGGHHPNQGSWTSETCWNHLPPGKKKLKALATGKKWVSIAVPALYWGWFGTSWAMKWVKRLYDMGWIKWGVEKLDRLHYWLPKTHILERYKREHHLCSLGLFLNFHGSKKDPSTHTFGSLKMLIILPVLDPVQ